MSASYLQIMKFEDLLADQPHVQNNIHQLEEEVERLQEELDRELALNTVLNSALHGSSVLSHPSLSPLPPPQVQALLAELAMAEEEIVWLERKIKDLKLGLHRERRLTEELQLPPFLQHGHRQRRPQRQNHHLPCRPGNALVISNLEHRSRSQSFKEFRKAKVARQRQASIGSMSDILTIPSTIFNEVGNERSRRLRRPETYSSRSRRHAEEEIDSIENPNELSEELIKCLVNIFLELNRACREEEPAIVPKLTLSCISSSSRSLASKNSLSFKGPTYHSHDKHPSACLDPYNILADSDSSNPARDVGPYKNLIQITRHSLDATRFSECLQSMGRLRVLMDKLCDVDLTFLSYKQKLAFWINIYNACIMHAFLEHGMPSTQEKLLALMNKAALNVGGIVLNALAIEHFILRHPCESKASPADEKEMLLRHAYGLGYPETNVTFALCRGSWSSPALRVYTADNVASELGRARVEYLEAAVGVTSKGKIVVPKLLQWHMLDFADDIESLLEWIYSQLPRTGTLKRSMMECLNGSGKSPVSRMVEIQPYDFEFRYLLSG